MPHHPDQLTLPLEWREDPYFRQALGRLTRPELDEALLVAAEDYLASTGETVEERSNIEHQD